MVGITGFGAYVPRYRLPREVIAREWGHASLGGEKAVANHDEDSVTLAVSAAINVVPDSSPARLGGVFFASTTSPYREKAAAATVAAVLDCGTSVRTADFTDSLRAGTSALLAAADTARAGTTPVLVCAGDCRLGEPDSIREQNYGDAGAALLVGTDEGRVLATIVGTHSVSEDFLGTWRTEGQDFLHQFPGAFESKFGHASFVTAAVQGLLQQTGTRAEQIATALIAAPTPRALPGVAKSLGLDPKKQIPDSLWTLIGDTGTTQPLLLLAGALERAKPGDLILLASYGDGADALLLQATDALASYRTTRSLFSQIERKRLLTSYGRYARFRHLIRKETTPEDVSTPVVLYRDRKAILSLYGGRCPACSTVQFPKPRVCVECGHRGGIDDHKLSRRGAVFTFTNDYLFESPDSPVAHAVVDLEGGGRLFVQMTDCDADAVAIDLPVELTFRKYHEGSGIHNYFWKARPV